MYGCYGWIVFFQVFLYVCECDVGIDEIVDQQYVVCQVVVCYCDVLCDVEFVLFGVGCFLV